MEFGPSLSAYAAPSIYLRARKQPPKKKKSPQASTVSDAPHVEDDGKKGVEGTYNGGDGNNAAAAAAGDNTNNKDTAGNHSKNETSAITGDKKAQSQAQATNDAKAGSGSGSGSSRKRAGSFRTTAASLGLLRPSRHVKTPSGSASSENSIHSRPSDEHSLSLQVTSSSSTSSAAVASTATTAATTTTTGTGTAASSAPPPALTAITTTTTTDPTTPTTNSLIKTTSDNNATLSEIPVATRPHSLTSSQHDFSSSLWHFKLSRRKADAGPSSHANANANADPAYPPSLDPTTSGSIPDSDSTPQGNRHRQRHQQQQQQQQQQHHYDQEQNKKALIANPATSLVHDNKTTIHVTSPPASSGGAAANEYSSDSNSRSNVNVPTAPTAPPTAPITAGAACWSTPTPTPDLPTTTTKHNTSTSTNNNHHYNNNNNNNNNQINFSIKRQTIDKISSPSSSIATASASASAPIISVSTSAPISAPAPAAIAAAATAATAATTTPVERFTTAPERLPASSVDPSKQDQPNQSADIPIPPSTVIHHDLGNHPNKLQKRDPHYHHRPQQKSLPRSSFIASARSRACQLQSRRPSAPSSLPSTSHHYAGIASASPVPLASAESKQEHEDMVSELTHSNSFAYMAPPPRNQSVSSASGASTRTARMASNENLPASLAEGSISTSTASGTAKPQLASTKPFVVRNNRTYIHDPTLQYPLPVDLAELHRQSLRTLLLFQLFGGPITSPAFSSKPPTRVLEVGCGSGFWSMMCHRYFAQHGHVNIAFTGIDIAPLAGTGPDPNSKPDKDMRWRFVQHDIRRLPWPLPDGEFDLIMVKDMALAGSVGFQGNMDEFHRLLRPGGVLEVWETDHTVRMLRPHAPKAKASSAARLDDTSDSSSDEDDEEDDATRLGAYVMTANTPLSAPLNTFLVEYNGWITKALEQRGLSAVPCTLIGPWLLQEAEDLMDVRSKRLAVPLSEIRWEREGVGGVVTKDGKSYIDSMKGKNKAAAAAAAAADAKGGAGGGGGGGGGGRAAGSGSGKTLTTGQTALRRTALETVVGLIHSFEPILREVSGKSQDEWDNWTGKMMNDLLREGGTSWGECLEVGAWSARKRKK